MLKAFYTAIKARLQSIVVNTANPNPELPDIVTPVIKQVGVWNNQYTYEEEYKAIKYPHVFIEFASLPWESTGNKQQQASAIVRLHVGSRSIDYESLDHFDLLDVINYWLKGFSGTNFGTFTRVSTEIDHNRDELIAHVITYRVRVTDTSAVRNLINVQGDLLFMQVAVNNSVPKPDVPEPEE